MKKTIALLLALSMCLGLFLGCEQKQPEVVEPQETVAPVAEPVVQENLVDEDLDTALEYLRVYYKNAPEKTPMDYSRIGSVRIGTKVYPIVWTVEIDNADALQVVPGDDDTVTIDVNEKLTRASMEAFPYVLKATLTGTDGREVFLTWDMMIPAGIDEEALAVIDQAYALPAGGQLDGTYTLTGVIVSIDSLYSDQYKNITVTIAVPGREDFPIQCYRMKGEGADKLAAGDTITVTGVLKNYKGTIEFDSGCILEAVESGGGAAPVVPDTVAEILSQAAALADGKSLPYSATLTGKITRVAYLYNGSYISVTMWVDGYNVYCYRLTGAGIENLNVNDVITVSGEITKYRGVIEVNRGVLISYENHNTPYVPTDPHEIVDMGYALAEGGSMPYNVKLTGLVTKITTPYSPQYNNVTVVIQVAGRETKPITCYRMKGDGADTVKVGDTITVSGEIQNYKGTVEFNYPKLLSIVPGAVTPTMTPEETVDAAYALADGESMNSASTLTGKITSIPTAYSAQYQNITVVIEVPGRESKPITCYRMKGTGADALVIGDTITVTGILKNYKGTIEFDTGCTFVKAASTPTTPAEIVDAAYALATGESMASPSTLTGKITSIPTAYSTQYQNITVVIEIPGRESKPITCFRMKGAGADALAVGDEITVTGTLKNYNGTIEFDAGCTFVKDSTTPTTPTTPAEIVDAAYELGVGESLPNSTTLSGTITGITTPYSTQYQNITVVIQVPGRESKPITCFRMKGAGADALAIGDKITVTGKLMNYNGTVEFDAGCTFVKDSTTPTTPTTPAEIVDALYALESGKSLPGTYSLTGTISSIPTAYSTQFQNITVVIQVPGRESMPVTCYRMKGTGADSLAVGDTITVTGTLKNYNGTREFDANCTFVKAPSAPATPTTPAEIVDALYALESGKSLPGTYSLTGTISSIPTAYSTQFQNITVVIQVPGRESMPVTCYRMKGAGADALAVGDTITVTGTLKNYNGTREFDANCTFTKIASEPTTPTTPAEIVDAAYALGTGETLSNGPYTLAGAISSIDTAYSAQYDNITVTIQVFGKAFKCYRLTGTGADALAVGDQIAVTGNLTNYKGSIQFAAGCTFTKIASEPTTPTTPAEIVDAAYALGTGETLSNGPFTLAGAISAINTPYSEQYGNITVTIQVFGKAFKCYRLTGTGAADLAIGDEIAVTGNLTNYNGSIQFAQGCSFTMIKKAEPVQDKPETQEEIVSAAYALAEDESLAGGPYTLGGSISSIDTAYSEQYGNITVTIQVFGKAIKCYRLTGAGAADLAVGDNIAVTGNLTNYKGSIQFAAGCTFSVY